MSRTVIVALVAVGIVTLAVGSYLYVVLIVAKGELGEAPGWTVLQGLEVQYRGNSDTTSPILLSNPLESPYMVLGLPAEDTKYPRAWVILNETRPNGSVYMLPQDGNLKVRCGDIDELSAKVKIVPAVLKLLRAKCKS